MHHSLIRPDLNPDYTAIHRLMIARAGEQPTTDTLASAAAYALDCALVELCGHHREAVFDHAVSHWDRSPSAETIAQYKRHREEAAERAEMIDFIDREGYPHERYRVRIGPVTKSHAVLTTEELAGIVKQIKDDALETDRMSRENLAALIEHHREYEVA